MGTEQLSKIMLSRLEVARIWIPPIAFSCPSLLWKSYLPFTNISPVIWKGIKNNYQINESQNELYLKTQAGGISFTCLKDEQPAALESSGGKPSIPWGAFLSRRPPPPNMVEKSRFSGVELAEKAQVSFPYINVTVSEMQWQQTRHSKKLLQQRNHISNFPDRDTWQSLLLCLIIKLLSHLELCSVRNCNKVRGNLKDMKLCLKMGSLLLWSYSLAELIWMCKSHYSALGLLFS